MARPTLRRATRIPRTVARAPIKRRRRGKYNAVKTVVDGIRFDSKREAKRYLELVAAAKAGTIERLTLQPEFPLHACNPATGELIVVGKYRADFRYLKDGAVIIEDVKGMLTPIYRWKKKHLKAEYGISILET